METISRSFTLRIILLAIINIFLSAEPLDSLIQKMRTVNPELIAASAKYDATRQGAAVFYSIPDPWLSAEFSSGMFMYSVSQELPFPTKQVYRRSQTITETQRAYEYNRKVELRLIAELKRSIIKYDLVLKNIGSLKSIITYLNQVNSIADRLYPLKKMPLADVLRIRVELSHKDIELKNLYNDRSQAARVINSLFNQPMDTLVEGIPDIKQWTRIPETSELLKAARDSNPELRAMLSSIKSANIMQSLAVQEYLPDLMFKYEHERDDQGMTDNRFMMGITLPIWFWSKQNRMAKQASYEKKMTEADYAKAENDVALMVTDLSYRLQQLRRTMQLYETTVLPQSKAALDAAIAAFASSQSGMIEVLDSEQMYAENMFEFNQVSADFLMAQAELEQAIGKALP